MNIISDDYTIEPSLKRFASVLPNIVWITDSHGSVVFCNDYGLEFLGLKQEDIDNEQWAGTVHPDEISAISEKWMSALQNKIPFENIQRQRNKNGEYEWFKVKANPHFDSSGEITHWIGISININDEIELRKKLEKANSRMDLSIQNTNSGTWDWDIQNDIIVYNDNWWEMLGFKKGEIEETTEVWENLLHPEDKERAIRELNKHLKGASKFYESIYRLKTKSGAWKWIYDSGKIIDRNEKGNPLRFVGIQQDYSSRKSNEDMLIENEQKMRILADSAQKMLEFESIAEIENYIVDEIFKHIDGRGIVTFTEFNLEEQTWTISCHRGFSPLLKNISTILGRPIEGLKGPIDSQRVSKFMTSSMIVYDLSVEESLKGVITSQLVSRLKKFINLDKGYGIGIIKNNKVYGNVTIIPKNPSIKLDSDFLETIVYQAACAIDKKDIEIKIKQKNKILSNLNEELDLVIQGLSHDLKSPIHTAKGLLKIRNDISDSEFSEGIEKSLNNLDNITKDLLDIVINHRTEIIPSQINFKDLLSDCIEESNDIDNYSEINWKLNIEQKAKFYSDISRFKLIFRNLLSNAIKYQKNDIKEKSIKVKIKSDSKEALIEVEDNGIGMSEKDTEHIFDIFYRVDSNSKGTGLGLNILKKTVEKLNGIIEVKSKLDKGTVFSISIPNLKAR